MKLEKYCHNCKFIIEGKCEVRETPDVVDGVFKCWLPYYKYSIELVGMLDPNERDEYLFSDIYEEEHLVRKIETGKFEESDEDDQEEE